MDTHEERIAAFEAETRDKYNVKERKEMAGKEAMPDESFPIKDKEDVEKAIKAVGMGDSSHNAIRKHIMARASALGCSDLIPDTWQADGSLKQQNDADTVVEERAKCSTCDGTGKIRDGHVKCPDCGGTGNATEARDETAQGAERQSKAPVARRKRERHRAIPLMPEIRHFSATRLEVRSSSTSDEILISGEPIVYNEPYTVVDMFGEFEERMLPGVASDVLARGADVRFLINHEGLPLARTTSGTMALEDSATALRFVAKLDARQQLANDLAIAIEREDLSQMSCGFIVAHDKWNEAKDQRSVTKFADLLDVSGVTYPASPTTTLKIAQRMALAMPEESRARVRQMYVEVRAGKVLSQGNQDKLVGAVKTLHEVLGGAGFDPADLIEEPNDGDEQELGDEREPGVSTTDDASQGGDATGAEASAPGYTDGTGARSQVDPGEKIRGSSAARLRLQLEARKRRRIAA